MTTVDDAINQLRTDYLLTGRREERNRLSQTVDASSDTLTFEFAVKSIQEGAKVSVGLEDMGVWSSSAGSKTAVVQRGDFGSTAAAHTTGDLAIINARWSNAQILRALNDELEALYSGSHRLFQMSEINITQDPSQVGYDITGSGSDIEVWDVRYAAIGPEEDWPRVKFWEQQRGMATADFASGNALFIREATDPGQTIRVWFKAPFTTLASLTDDLNTDAGVPTSAHDVVVMGAAIRLISGREVTRNLDESQGDTRRANEVPPGANLGGLRGMMTMYDRRREQEALRLNKLFPTHRRS